MDGFEDRVEGVPSTLATAIRTVVITVFASRRWCSGQISSWRYQPSRAGRLFLALSGLATGVSWLPYCRALQMAPASWVAPIDKLCLPFTIILAALWLRGPLTWQVATGAALMAIGALITRA